MAPALQGGTRGHFTLPTHTPDTPTLAVALEEDGLSLQQQHDAYGVRTLRPLGRFGTQELVRLVHCLEHTLGSCELN